MKKNIVLTVPKGSLAAYKAAANWDGFKEYKEADGGGGGGGTGSDEPYALVDGIYYEMDHTANTASVISGYQAGITQTPYSGVVTVPSTFIYNTKTYTVTAVKGMAFQNATCTEVTLPSSCTTINAYSFSNMSSLVKLDIGGTAEIKGNGITDCVALRDLYIGFTGGVVGTVNASIPATLRQNINVHLPANSITSDLAKSYKSNSFWTATRALLCNNELQIGDLYYRYDATKKTATMMAPYIIPGNGAPKQIGPEVDVPGTITVDGTEYVVDNLEAGAFYQTQNVTSVTFHEDLKNIEYETFYACNIAEITLPNSLENIAYNNFYSCPKLTKVSFGTGLKTIGQNTFYKCPLLTNIEVQATVPPTPATGATSIFNANFNKSAATLTVPAGTTAAYQADANWSNLKRVNITNLDSWMNISFRDPQATPFNMDSVQMYLNGELVTAVHIPGTMKALKPYVFQGVSSIKSLVIDNGVRLISQNAFKNCKNLQAVVIPSSVDSIGMSAFSGCSSLASVQLPEGIKTIASSAFSNTGLTKITLPESVTLVDNQAFQNCAALKTATLGSSLKKLNLLVFNGCTALDTLTVKAAVPPTFFIASIPGQDMNPFSTSIYATCRLYVPESSLALYKEADVWKEFARIRAIGSVESEKAVIDGISYELFADDSTATVLASPDYTGEITVPDTVVYNSKTYSVTTIAPRAFAGTNIDILRLPANIKAIPEEMAANCTKLISVGLPDHLETIGVRAFSGSPNIRFIRCVNYGKNHSLVPPSFTATAESDYGQAFSSEIWPDCMLAIPAGMFMNYKECAGWKNFKTFAYWHDTDVSPDSIYFTGKMSGEERKVRTLTPVTIPANATILNFVVQNSNPESVEISTEYVDSKTMRLQAKLVKVGTADVTVYANLVKTSFMISVSVYTGIEDVDADASPARYFTLDGIEVAHPQKGVMNIKIQQNKSQKVVY